MLPDLAPPLWTRDAACLGLASAEKDPWHPIGHGSAALYAEARQICEGCPVRPDCLEFALARNPIADVRGMFGGLTPEELRDLAKSRGLAVRRVAEHGSRARYAGGHGQPGCRCQPCRRANWRYEAARRIRVA